MKIALISLLLLTGCTSLMEQKRARVEQCIIKMRNEGEIPPLKAAHICRTIHGVSLKDLQTEKDMEND